MLVKVSEDQRPEPKKPATYQDVIDAPEHKVAEILDGELFLSPRPAMRHASATSRLNAIVSPTFSQGMGGLGGWTILIEPELHLALDVVVPDLAGWKLERMPVFPEEAAFCTIVPNCVCEVLSPSTVRIDRLKKLHIYERESVSHVWLIDPIERTLEVYRLEATGLRLFKVYGDQVTVRIEPFEALEFELARLWPYSMPQPTDNETDTSPTAHS